MITWPSRSRNLACTIDCFESQGEKRIGESNRLAFFLRLLMENARSRYCVPKERFPSLGNGAASPCVFATSSGLPSASNPLALSTADPSGRFITQTLPLSLSFSIRPSPFVEQFPLRWECPCFTGAYIKLLFRVGRRTVGGRLRSASHCSPACPRCFCLAFARSRCHLTVKQCLSVSSLALHFVALFI